MIIAYICGGLGNQMFQYAAGRRLADHLGVPLKLDLSEYKSGTENRPADFAAFRRPVKLYELSVNESAATDVEIGSLKDRFGTATTVARTVRQLRKIAGKTWLWPVSHVLEKEYRFDPRILPLGDNCYLQGFWQSPKYFADIAQTIRTAFEFKDPSIRAAAAAEMANLKQHGDTIVAIHVRRGDLAHAVEKLKDTTKVHGVPVGIPYIRSAIKRFDERAKFLVFSDTAADIAWCRANIPGDGIREDRLLFSEGKTDLADMALMSSADHNVIANSTFSWWSAWLNRTPGRRVIAPAQWAQPGSKPMPTDDLIPPEWETI